MNKIRKFFFGIVCCFAFSSAHAGIPVFDGVSVANLITQYQQLIQQYQMLKNQYNTAKDQLDSMTGSRGMAGLLTNPAVLSQLPPDWSNVMSNIKSSGTYAAERAKFPATQDLKLKAVYDNMAVNNATMIDFFAKANLRMQQVAQLQAKIDDAADPAAKADLQSRLVAEQNSIAGTTQLLSILQQKQAQELAAARAAAADNQMCREFKNPGC